MTNIKYDFFEKKIKSSLMYLYFILSAYAISFLLFICSVEYVILHSLNKNGQFVWNNLNIIWIIGLVMLFLVVIVNIWFYFYILKFEKNIIKNFFNEIVLKNKYLEKWKLKVKNHLSTKIFFLNIFNILVWLTSLKINLNYAKNHKVGNEFVKNNDKITSIFEEYHNQLKQKENDKNQ